MSKTDDMTTFGSFEPTLAVDKPLTWWKTLLIFWDALSSTALSRCWPALIVTAIWSSSICVLNYYTHGKVSIQPTVITVFGTVLGFIISFRTSSSFERYNEGAKLWSHIVLNCRTFARTVWFHVPDNAFPAPPKDCHRPIADEITDQDPAKTHKEYAMTLIEKKTVVNLLEAFVPSRPFLSSRHYSFPAIIPSKNDQIRILRRRHTHDLNHDESEFSGGAVAQTHEMAVPGSLSRPDNRSFWTGTTTKTIAPPYYDAESLLPAELPPRHGWRAAFPFPIFFWVWGIIKKHSCKLGADNTRQNFRPSKNNVPLEISLYLTSYISALQTRGTVGDSTLGVLCETLNHLVETLTGLERILATPIPFSYSSHLWMITVLYCAALPFQLWSTLKWFTIPATVIASLAFYGFLMAGEEIERKELHAITATPAPNPAVWAFSKENNFLQVGQYSKENSDKIPAAWVDKGREEILRALHGSQNI
ncbi:Bestrophin, RFP-TM, chloride channel-domain-containing protein [Suillus subaureus]|uniref:Bestrophin, RFP-TM, chloride channel-domain-containing protein n=1 Tax=Suillus subaureus TaxID=48587 RepID=A0A9P7E9H7_9AGAM|nr:Bestrophin, RFP-TM, chloride channel-domain-containing protein [Suillus subaureus]KAG1814701.1 Bestrophin, RFP-TM, chloride channel-domain-containing protein [Suillus subaureus]